MKIRFWGVRGSVPTTAASAAGIGGNTPCVEAVLPDGRRIIFDAGTGIRQLGHELARSGLPVRADLFLTHFHWDHIQGLPFFQPLLSSATAICIHAPPQGTLDGRLLLGKMASPTYFPLPLQAFGADIRFMHVSDEPWTAAGVRITSARTNHPAHTRGYRLDANGVSIAYVPDHEIGADQEGDDRVLQLVDGVDVLIHDAMFTAAEYRSRVGWGHSAGETAVALALRAGARMLCLFHHDPDRTDTEVDGIARRLQEFADRHAAQAGELRVEAAAENDTIQLRRGRGIQLIPASAASLCGRGGAAATTSPE